MRDRARKLLADTQLLVNRIRFDIFFRRNPPAGKYCNSKFIRLDKQPTGGAANRPYLAIIRCGARHELIEDTSERNFDVALNLYAPGVDPGRSGAEYVFTGGISKYRAAHQFITEELLDRYAGFIFLDDDLRISYSQLSQFLEYCTAQGFGLAQPSLTADSSYCHSHLVNESPRGWRPVPMVEVMCPYFSSTALRQVLFTFPLSDSSWGIDLIWPRLFPFAPVVVDEFQIAHVRVSGSGGFYAYMRSIGVSPRQEMIALRDLSAEALQELQQRPSAPAGSFGRLDSSGRYGRSC
jgi:hypothetical protein